MDERRDDWQREVDENLASLNAGQRVWERDLTLLRKVMGDIDRLLRGDPEKDTEGVIARIHDIERQLSKLNAVLFVDSTGKKGLIHDVYELRGEEKRVVERWKFATAITVAIIGFLGLFISNWDKIIKAAGVGRPPDKLERMINNAKRPPNSGKVRVKVRYVEPPATDLSVP